MSADADACLSFSLLRVGLRSSLRRRASAPRSETLLLVLDGRAITRPLPIAHALEARVGWLCGHMDQKPSKDVNARIDEDRRCGKL